MPAKKPTGNKTTYKEIYTAMAEIHELYPKNMKVILDDFMDSIVVELKAGNNVQLPIGQFKRADRKAGKGRNPSTGEMVKTKASNGANFKVGAKLKEELN